MLELVDLPDRAALAHHLGVAEDRVTIESYSEVPDDRIGWPRNSVVSVDGALVGFTDAVPDEKGGA